MNYYCLSRTALGTLILSWSNDSITRLSLPVNKRELLLKEILKFRSFSTFCKSPPTWIKKILKRINNHLQGNFDDFQDVKIDLLQFKEFSRNIYKSLRLIKPGKTISYKKLAKMANHENASQAVGTAMAKNPVPLIIPCHRVIKSNGLLGEFSALGGVSQKKRLLTIEKVL